MSESTVAKTTRARRRRDIAILESQDRATPTITSRTIRVAPADEQTNPYTISSRSVATNASFHLS